jgi:hypothetical protein
MASSLILLLLFAATRVSSGATYPVSKFPFSTAQVSALCAAEDFKIDPYDVTCRFTGTTIKSLILSCSSPHCDSFNTLGNHFISKGVANIIGGMCAMSETKYAVLKCGKRSIKTAYITFADNGVECKKAVQQSLAYVPFVTNYPICKPFSAASTSDNAMLPALKFPFSAAQVSSLCAANNFKRNPSDPFGITCRFTGTTIKYLILSCSSPKCDKGVLGSNYTPGAYNYMLNGVVQAIEGICAVSETKYAVLKCGKTSIKTAYIMFSDDGVGCKKAVQQSIAYTYIGFNYYPKCEPFPVTKPAKKVTKKLT